MVLGTALEPLEIVLNNITDNLEHLLQTDNNVFQISATRTGTGDHSGPQSSAATRKLFKIIGVTTTFGGLIYFGANKYFFN